MAYTNSSLVSYTKLSPNHSGQRTHAIDRITPHCVVGQCSVETLGSIFLPTSRQASCNYGIGVDGRVGMYVEEKNRSWCSSSSANDQRASHHRVCIRYRRAVCLQGCGLPEADHSMRGYLQEKRQEKAPVAWETRIKHWPMTPAV